MERFIPLEKDYYCVDVEEDHSDKEYDSESSEDEVQKTFASIAGVSRPAKKKKPQQDNKEFELEMENELSSAFEVRNSWFMEQQRMSVDQSIVPANGTLGQPSTSKPVTNDDDEDDDGVNLNQKGTESDEEFCQNEGLNEDSNDANLFYDPKSDQDNQNWVDSHRQTCHLSKRLPNSDAVLNCPCCMGVLCYDCQRHELYHTQYRAMFVVNCDIQNDQVLFQPRSGDRSKKQKMKGLNVKSGQKLSSAPEGSDPGDIFRTVLCAHCRTEVAAIDSDEVYHFFNVLSSYS